MLRDDTGATETFVMKPGNTYYIGDKVSGIENLGTVHTQTKLD